MKWTSLLLLLLLLSACACRYNGIDTREVLVSSPAPLSTVLDNDTIDVTKAQQIYTR
jgi:hypothetical protein